MLISGLFSGAGLLSRALDSSSVLAADLYVFPTERQSEEQIEKEKYSCLQGADEASGYDSTSPSHSSPGSGKAAGADDRPGRNVLGGAAKCAVVAGVANGDTGKHAAIDTRGGRLFGGKRKVRNQRSMEREQ